MKTRTLVAIACALGAAFGTAAADIPPPQNVLQLTASATVEVQQDLLMLTLGTTREGADANAVQAQLRAALESALAEARKTAQAGQMDVRTGNFALYPRYSTQGRITGWQGSAELVLEGRDFPRITQAAARVQTMTISGVGFTLSREQRQKVEGDAQAQAIERFRAKAGELARNFGFGGYTLREVSVNTNDAVPLPRMRMAAAEVRTAGAEAPVPVEAGKANVTVTVSGSVQLR